MSAFVVLTGNGRAFYMRASAVDVVEVPLEAENAPPWAKSVINGDRYVDKTPDEVVKLIDAVKEDK